MVNYKYYRTQKIRAVATICGIAYQRRVIVTVMNSDQIWAFLVREQQLSDFSKPSLLGFLCRREIFLLPWVGWSKQTPHFFHSKPNRGWQEYKRLVACHPCLFSGEFKLSIMLNVIICLFRTSHTNGQLTNSGLFQYFYNQQAHSSQNISNNIFQALFTEVRWRLSVDESEATACNS